jgi:hypothetical protein
MGATLFMMAIKTRWKLPAILGLGLAGAVGLMMAPADYIERLRSITEAQDASVIGRLVSWKVALEMIKDKPLFGIGFKNMVFDYQTYLTRVEIPAAWGEIPSRVAHNSYLQVCAETGTIAFTVFMFMILSTIALMRRVARTVRRTADAWVLPFTNSVEVTLYGFLTGALFLNRAHFDLLYQLVAIAAALPAVVVAREMQPPEQRRGVDHVHHHAGPAAVHLVVEERQHGVDVAGLEVVERQVPPIVDLQEAVARPAVVTAHPGDSLGLPVLHLHHMRHGVLRPAIPRL